MLARMRIFHVAIITALALAAGCSTPAPRTSPTAPVAVTVVPGVQAVEPPKQAVPQQSTRDDTLAELRRLAPQADPGVLALALAARSCAVDSGEVTADSRLAVIDYSLPSTQRRLWVFEMRAPALLHHEYVAHGQGSGGNYATSFSNKDGSHQTSLGLFRTAETYVGGNGYSLRLDGLEPGINDNARSRAIVIHGAWYVDPAFAAKQGRLGRSHGCPALRQEVARVVIDELKQDNLLFSYADNAAWLDRSGDFACAGRNARQILADARAPATGGMQVAAM